MQVVIPTAFFVDYISPAVLVMLTDISAGLHPTSRNLLIAAGSCTLATFGRSTTTHTA